MYVWGVAEGETIIGMIQNSFFINRNIVIFFQTANTSAQMTTQLIK